MAAFVATLSTSPETTDWLTGFIFMWQQGEDTKIKTKKINIFSLLQCSITENLY